MKKLRWDPCIVQNASEFREFLVNHIDVPNKRCLLIGGAGFDPRAAMVPSIIKDLHACSVKGVFFREERTLDQPKLREKADRTQATIANILPSAEFPAIEIFDAGVTAVGGRRAVEYLEQIEYTEYTDVIVDISSLSSSVFFPIVRYLVMKCDALIAACINLHLLVAEHPSVDHRIRGVPADSATLMHGFKGKRSLDSCTSEAVLWMPTLAPGHDACLTKIHHFIERKSIPIDVCPILPFPSTDPRLADQLVTEYGEHLSSWRVDHRDFVHAAESDPLDSYRAISSLCSERERLFSDFGGSLVILSPLGNKMLSVGAMLAAIEQDLPVAMVESVGYDEDLVPTLHGVRNDILRHVWLCGEAYGM